MTAVVIPGLDLVPSLPSRVVTVDLVDMTEGEQVAGAKIDFFLPGDLHVPADDKILQAGRVTLTLNANGHGEIRLPAYTDAVKPADWVIGVKKHWAPHPYYIRVPQGSTTISLADIDPVQQLPQGVVDWMITGVSLNVTEGGNWSGSGSISGGIINLDLIVPPGGTAWHRGVLPSGTDLNSLQNATTSGVYQLSSSSAYLNTPVPGVAATLTVEATGTSGVQTFTQYNSSRMWRRVMTNSSTNPRGWGAWTDLVADTSWYKGNYPGGALADHSTSGLYYASTPASVPDWPTYLRNVPCHVEFWVANGKPRRILVTSVGAREGAWETFADASGNLTGKWRRADNDYQRDFTSGEDILDPDLPDGRYGIPAAVAATLVGKPDGTSGTGTAIRFNLASSNVKFMFYMSYGVGGGLWFNRVQSALDQTWEGWVKLDGGGGSAASAAPLGLNRQALRDAFTSRRGGRIGTGGKGAVAIRLDDSINGIINAGIATKLRELQLPATALYCSKMFTDPDLLALNNMGSWQTVLDWAHGQGMEVWHHGGNHKDASGEAALRREIVESLEDLQGHLPTVEVNKWAQPGVGGTNYDGFAGTHTAEQLYGTTAGRLIAEGHAVSNGHTAGQIHPLDGTVRDSVWHFGVDRPDALAEAYDVIDQAAELGAGVTIMVHPNNLDRDSTYSTSADYLDLLDYIAQLRDEGKIEVLTMSGLMCADATTSFRGQIIRNGDFSKGLDNWSGSAGWAVTDGIATTSGTTMLTQSHAIDRHGWFMGGTMQLVAVVRATAGAIVRLEQGDALTPANWSAQQDYTIPAGPEWITIRLNSVTPLGMSRYGDYTRTRIGRVSGGQLEVRSVEYVPV